MTRDTSHRTRMSFLTNRARYGFLGDTQEDIGQPSSRPPPPPQQPQETVPPSPSTRPRGTRCSPLLSVLTHFGMRLRSTESSLLRTWEALRADMRTILANQATILQQQQTMQTHLAQFLAFHQPPPPPPQ